MSIFKPRTSVVTIYTEDYLDRIRHLELQAEAAKDSLTGVPLTNDEVPEYLTLAQEHDALVKEAEAAAVHVRLAALPRNEWQDLVDKHPPRTKDDKGATEEEIAYDRLAGVNEKTFKEVLVPASIIEPADLTAEDLQQISDIDFQRLYLTSYHLNRAVANDPKASLVSRLTQTSDETSS